MKDNYIVVYYDVRFGRLEARFKKLDTATSYFEEIKRDEDTLSAELFAMCRMFKHVKGEKK